jgi:hypothetical protein
MNDEEIAFCWHFLDPSIQAWFASALWARFLGVQLHVAAHS